MSTIAHFLAEKTCELMIQRIKDNISTALAEVSDLWGDNQVALGVPRQYFVYEAKGFMAPAVFVIADSMDFQLQRGANFICATVQVNVSVVVENKDLNNLTRQAYRYQAAIHKILAQEPIIGLDAQNNPRVKITTKVERAEFSPIFTDSQEENNPKGVFRKEVWLSCSVEHWERLG